MIATKELEFTIENAQEIAREYVSIAFGPTYFLSRGEASNDGWHFMIKCHSDDMDRPPAIGDVVVCTSGQVKALSEDRIRDMKEVGEVQAAKARGEEFARDKNGYVLRYHARIKANNWTTSYIDHKVGAREGILIPVVKPIWRFSIKDSLAGVDEHTLDVIDVDAQTGHVFPLTQRQVEMIVGGLSAARRLRKPVTTE